MYVQCSSLIIVYHLYIYISYNSNKFRLIKTTTYTLLIQLSIEQITYIRSTYVYINCM